MCLEEGKHVKEPLNVAYSDRSADCRTGFTPGMATGGGLVTGSTCAKAELVRPNLGFAGAPAGLGG